MRSFFLTEFTNNIFPLVSKCDAQAATAPHIPQTTHCHPSCRGTPGVSHLSSVKKLFICRSASVTTPIRCRTDGAARKAEFHQLCFGLILQQLNKRKIKKKKHTHTQTRRFKKPTDSLRPQFVCPPVYNHTAVLVLTCCKAKELAAN